MINTNTKANKLANEKSPYPLQHAHTPGVKELSPKQTLKKNPFSKYRIFMLSLVLVSY